MRTHRIVSNKNYLMSMRTHCIVSNVIGDQGETNNQHRRTPNPKQNYGNIDVVTADVEMGILIVARCLVHNPNPDPECSTYQTS